MGTIEIFIVLGTAMILLSIPMILVSVFRPRGAALVPCPDCGRRLSPKAVMCPHCGRPRG